MKMIYLKIVSKSISLILKIILNKSVLTGEISFTFKRSRSISLFKSGDKILCINYQPITLSLTLCIIFEKYINGTIVDILNKKFVIWDKQYCFLIWNVCQCSLLTTLFGKY